MVLPPRPRDAIVEGFFAALRCTASTGLAERLVKLCRAGACLDAAKISKSEVFQRSLLPFSCDRSAALFCTGTSVFVLPRVAPEIIASCVNKDLQSLTRRGMIVVSPSNGMVTTQLGCRNCIDPFGLLPCRTVSFVNSEIMTLTERNRYVCGLGDWQAVTVFALALNIGVVTTRFSCQRIWL